MSATLPASPSRPSVLRVANESIVFLGRNLRRMIRMPAVIVSTLVFPAVLMLVMTAAFRGVVEGFSSANYPNLLVPAMVTTSAAFGSIGSGLALFDDISSGLVERVRTLPVTTGSLFIGRILADVVRAMIASVVLIGIGTLLGYQFSGGIMGLIGLLLFSGLITVGFGWMSLAMAVGANRMEAIQAPLSALFTILMFLAEGFIPVEGFPSWIHDVVRANPFTVFRRCLNAFATSEPLLEPFIQSGVWLLFFTVVFAPIAILRFRKVAR